MNAFLKLCAFLKLSLPFPSRTHSGVRQNCDIFVCLLMRVCLQCVVLIPSLYWPIATRVFFWTVCMCVPLLTNLLVYIPLLIEPHLKVCRETYSFCILPWFVTEKEEKWGLWILVLSSYQRLTTSDHANTLHPCVRPTTFTRFTQLLHS